MSLTIEASWADALVAARTEQLRCRVTTVSARLREILCLLLERFSKGAIKQLPLRTYLYILMNNSSTRMNGTQTLPINSSWVKSLCTSVHDRSSVVIVLSLMIAAPGSPTCVSLHDVLFTQTLECYDKINRLLSESYSYSLVPRVPVAGDWVDRARSACDTDSPPSGVFERLFRHPLTIEQLHADYVNIGKSVDQFSQLFTRVAGSIASRSLSTEHLSSADLELYAPLLLATLHVYHLCTITGGGALFAERSRAVFRQQHTALLWTLLKKRFAVRADLINWIARHLPASARVEPASTLPELLASRGVDIGLRISGGVRAFPRALAFDGVHAWKGELFVESHCIEKFATLVVSALFGRMIADYDHQAMRSTMQPREELSAFYTAVRDRIENRLMHVRSLHAQRSAQRVLLPDIEDLGQKNGCAPLCMAVPHWALRKEHRLAHLSRVKYFQLLIDCGYSVEEIEGYLERELNGDTQRQREYSAAARREALHIASANTACSSMLSDSFISAPEREKTRGCPFHEIRNPAELVTLLIASGLDPDAHREQIERIVSTARENRPLVACMQHARAQLTSIGVAPPSYENGAQFPFHSPAERLRWTGGARGAPGAPSAPGAPMSM